MQIPPLRHPSPNPVFGIYKGHRPTHYGQYTWGKYKDYNIEIYDAKRDKMKLQYVSDQLKRWVKSKLIYFENGIKKITRSERNVTSN